MTQSQLLEFLKELSHTGAVVHIHVSADISKDRQFETVEDDGSPVAPPDIPDLSYYYGIKR